MRIQGTNISPVINFFFRFICFTCMYAWPTCIYVYHTHSSCLWRSEEGIRSPEVRVMDDREPLHGCWESNMGPLHEQQVLLTTEPSPSFSVTNFHNQIISSFFSSPTVVKCWLRYLLWFYWNILFFFNTTTHDSSCFVCQTSRCNFLTRLKSTFQPDCSDPEALREESMLTDNPFPCSCLAGISAFLPHLHQELLSHPRNALFCGLLRKPPQHIPCVSSGPAVETPKVSKDSHVA